MVSGCVVRAGKTLAPSMLNWIGGWSLTEVSGCLLRDEDEGLWHTLEVVLTQDAGAKGKPDT